jgi:hypothetical protein
MAKNLKLALLVLSALLGHDAASQASDPSEIPMETHDDATSASALADCCIGAECFGTIPIAACLELADTRDELRTVATPTAAVRPEQPAAVVPNELESEFESVRVVACEDVVVRKWEDGRKFAPGIYGRCQVELGATCGTGPVEVVLWRRFQDNNGDGWERLRQPRNDESFDVSVDRANLLWGMPLVRYAYHGVSRC